MGLAGGLANNGGQSASVVTGVRLPGIEIPHGALNRWYGAKLGSASQLLEVVCFGDSTTFGQASDGAGGTIYHSWTQYLKALAIAAGMTDGGRGVAGWNDNSSMSPDGYSTVVSKTATWHAQSNYSPYLSAGFQCSGQVSAGDVLVLKGKGTAIRLGITYRNQVTGLFTVSIDGGATVQYSCAGTAANNNFIDWKTIATGLTDGDHTVTITTLDTGNVSVVPCFLRASGLVVHNVGISGKLMTDYFGTTTGNRSVAAMLGLTETILNASGQSWQMGQGASPVYPNPKLAILLLGGNDQSAMSNDANAQLYAMYLASGVGSFCETCRAAGCDALVLVPHFPWFNDFVYLGAARQAVYETARAHGVAVGDLGLALGSYVAAETAGYTYQHGTHLTLPGYQQWANWIWNNFLNLGFTP